MVNNKLQTIKEEDEYIHHVKLVGFCWPEALVMDTEGELENVFTQMCWFSSADIIKNHTLWL